MLFFVCAAAVLLVGPALADVGTNTYLPPNQNQGYDYQKPPQQFPTANVPQQVPYPQPPRPSYPSAPRPPPQEDHVHEPGMPFEFNYAVNDAQTAVDHSHKAVSDGDVVRGEYRVALPDGRVQLVRYTADWKNGYNAEVTYEGTPTYPSPPIGGGGGGQGGNPGAHPGYRY